MSAGRFAYLDSIRGIAALVVVAEHAALTLSEQYSHFAQSSIVQLFQNMELGRFGVMLFFLTSGFVIPWSLNTKYQSPLKRFAITRFFRLYPLYWLSMVLALLFGSYGYHYESYSQVFANISMMPKFMGHESLIAVFWTLQIEMVFYLICAFLFYFSVLRHRMLNFTVTLGWLFMSLVVAWVNSSFQREIPIALPLALFAMFYGGLLRQCFIDKSQEAQHDVMKLSICMVILMPLSLYLNYQVAWLDFLIANAGAFICFIVLISYFKITSNAIAYLGVISYSVYLMHPIILNGYMTLMDESALAIIPASWSIAIICISSICFAILTYKYVETPFIKLGREIQGRVSPPVSQRPV